MVLESEPVEFSKNTQIQKPQYWIRIFSCFNLNEWNLSKNKYRRKLLPSAIICDQKGEGSRDFKQSSVFLEVKDLLFYQEPDPWLEAFTFSLWDSVSSIVHGWPEQINKNYLGTCQNTVPPDSLPEIQFQQVWGWGVLEIYILRRSILNLMNWRIWEIQHKMVVIIVKCFTRLVWNASRFEPENINFVGYYRIFTTFKKNI